MECPASVNDVQSRYFRALTTRETTVTLTLLGDAWLDLQDEVADLVERLDEAADPQLPMRTRRVLAQAVVRVLKNPNSRKQESRGLDDAQRSWTLDDSISSGDLHFTDEELNSLRAADSTVTRGKAFSIMPAFDADCATVES